MLCIDDIILIDKKNYLDLILSLDIKINFENKCFRLRRIMTKYMKYNF